jgi:hypothetical protein
MDNFTGLMTYNILDRLAGYIILFLVIRFAIISAFKQINK